MTNTLKKIVVNALTNRVVNRLGFAFSQPFCSIFMLHRFSVPEQGIHGHEADFLRNTLEYLRKHRFNLISAEQLVKAIAEQQVLPKKSVCFTLDDGFWDQAEVSAPIFAAYDCPATYFVVTRFLDDECWMWDSKLEWIFDQLNDEKLIHIKLYLGDQMSNHSRRALFSHIIGLLKTRNEEQINEFLQALAHRVGLSIPEKAPPKYAAMTWDTARDLIRMGLKVGPHSVTHPILANESHDYSSWQINQSWKELKEKIPEASAVFCYPVGRYQQDFGDREMDIVAQSEMPGALAADPGFVSWQTEVNNINCLKRYGFPDDMWNFRQYATWLERAKDQLRR